MVGSVGLHGGNCWVIWWEVLIISWGVLRLHGDSPIRPRSQTDKLMYNFLESI